MKSREDWLCDQLDRDDLSDSLRVKYERELDSIAESHTKSQIAVKQAEEIETLEQRQASLDAKKERRASKLNMSVAEWEEQAKKYYSIDPTTFTVTSIARSSDVSKAETWPCIDMIDAQTKVIQLLDYKWVDHFERKNRPLADFKWIKP